ncbi:MAG: MCE family protein [Terriglobia bacterium]|nr:MAG: MCE family protein [Terriglobia bacterium]
MKNRNVTVGLFVAGGLLLFGGGMFLIGDRRQAFGRHMEYSSEFVNLAGLSMGAKVRVGGMDGGEVVAIDVPDSPRSRFRVRWRIGEKLGGLVRTDSMVTIETEGVVGGTYLAVRPGSSRGAPAPALATIPSTEPMELSAILTRGSGLLNDAQSLLNTVGGKLSGTLDTANATLSNVNDIAVGLKQGRGAAGMLLRDDALAKQIRQTVATSTSSIDEILAGLQAGRGPAGMLLRDEAVEGQIRESLRNMQQATANLDHASHQADALISDLNSQQIPQKVGAVVDSLGDTAKQAHQMVSDIAQPDRQGVTAGENIRESLMNANAASLNLADSSEALKHNFLLRGFFRHRGYYNLDRISPEQYRRDTAFTSRANHRAWLPASELFVEGANGEEELSMTGKAVLDGVLTEDGESIFESPIVIEGYCNGVGPADQLRLSRTRAILVRQYLQSHFQLDSSSVGIVAMKNSPPSGMERKTWDGICIVVLRRRTK